MSDCFSEEWGKKVVSHVVLHLAGGTSSLEEIVPDPAVYVLSFCPHNGYFVPCWSVTLRAMHASLVFDHIHKVATPRSCCKGC